MRAEPDRAPRRVVDWDAGCCCALPETPAVRSGNRHDRRRRNHRSIGSVPVVGGDPLIECNVGLLSSLSGVDNVGWKGRVHRLKSSKLSKPTSRCEANELDVNLFDFMSCCFESDREANTCSAFTTGSRLHSGKMKRHSEIVLGSGSQGTAKQTSLIHTLLISGQCSKTTQNHSAPPRQNSAETRFCPKFLQSQNPGTAFLTCI